MATSLGGFSILVSFYLAVCFFCNVCADELTVIEYSSVISDGNGLSIVERSRIVQHVQLERDDDTLFFRILLTSSRVFQTPYQDDDEPAFYGAQLHSTFRLPNATLVVCFGVVLCYILYIIIACVLRPLLNATEDEKNLKLTMLIQGRSFHDDIPPKLRELYSEMESGKGETLLLIPESKRSTAVEFTAVEDEEPVRDMKGEGLAAIHLFRPAP